MSIMEGSRGVDCGREPRRLMALELAYEHPARPCLKCSSESAFINSEAFWTSSSLCEVRSKRRVVKHSENQIDSDSSVADAILDFVVSISYAGSGSIDLVTVLVVSVVRQQSLQNTTTEP